MAPETAEALTPARRSALVKGLARALGFDSAGITDLEPTPHAEALDRWLAAGQAGTMRYMQRQADRRKRPATILAGATRAVVVTRNYFTADPPSQPATGRIARYARGRDYHRALAPALDRLASYLVALGASAARTRAFVDAGPVPERELAQRAGLGWIGKNTMLIDPERGSFCFLATVLTDCDLEADRPVTTDHCGSCTRCLEACPTNAFPEPRVLDATRCISYLTIEYHGPIAPELGGRMDDRVFGCDVCQDVCPWNAKFARPADPGVLELKSALGLVPLDAFERLDAPTFADRYGWTPLERPGLEGMRRNARIAAANARGETPCPTP